MVVKNPGSREKLFPEREANRQLVRSILAAWGMDKESIQQIMTEPQPPEQGQNNVKADQKNPPKGH